MTAPAKKKPPKKPRKGFPLYAHPRGQWAKTINGQKHYFGPWDDPDAAERRYEAERRSIRDGKSVRRSDSESLTLSDMFNDYLTFKKGRLSTSEMAQYSFEGNVKHCKIAVNCIGRNRLVSELQIEDFANLRRRLEITLKTPNSLRTAISTIKAAFNWARRNRKIPEVIFGEAFKSPFNQKT